MGTNRNFSLHHATLLFEKTKKSHCLNNVHLFWYLCYQIHSGSLTWKICGMVWNTGNFPLTRIKICWRGNPKTFSNIKTYVLNYIHLPGICKRRIQQAQNKTSMNIMSCHEMSRFGRHVVKWRMKGLGLFFMEENLDRTLKWE